MLQCLKLDVFETVKYFRTTRKKSLQITWSKLLQIAVSYRQTRVLAYQFAEKNQVEVGTEKLA
jgi:hypothetical protein